MDSLALRCGDLGVDERGKSKQAVASWFLGGRRSGRVMGVGANFLQTPP
jgi:hypothetical protein